MGDDYEDELIYHICLEFKNQFIIAGYVIKKVHALIGYYVSNIITQHFVISW